MKNLPEKKRYFILPLHNIKFTQKNTNMKKLQTKQAIVPFLAISFLLCSCISGESETIIENEKPTTSVTLVIDVDEKKMKDSNTHTELDSSLNPFEAGDAAGIYCWDGSDFIYKNIKYTLQMDGSWKTNTDIPYSDKYTYICYFPYTDNPYQVGMTGDVDMRFEAFIKDDDNRFWRMDQSERQGYAASNLMINTGTHIGSGGRVHFKLERKRAMALFEGDGLYRLSFTDCRPYTISSTRKVFLMKPLKTTEIAQYSLIAEKGEYIKRYMAKDYLQFTAAAYGTFTLTIPDGMTSEQLQTIAYSINGGETWTETKIDSTSKTITTPRIETGGSVLWKGRGSATAADDQHHAVFSSTTDFTISGNIMSLLYESLYENKTVLQQNYTFSGLFKGCTSLTDASELILPAKTLANYSYKQMFDNCHNLTAAPQLPATQLGSYCYQNMFFNCSILVPPTLPAINLAEGCYQGMFFGNKSITKAPVLPANTLAKSCYRSMFYNCTSLKEAPQLPATELAADCYSSMFLNCISLEKAPELPAEKLVEGCYKYMFSGCTNMNYIKAMFLTTPSYEYTAFWTYETSREGTFVKNEAATWTDTGINAIPEGWKIIKTKE